MDTTTSFGCNLSSTTQGKPTSPAEVQQHVVNSHNHPLPSPGSNACSSLSASVTFRAPSTSLVRRFLGGRSHRWTATAGSSATCLRYCSAWIHTCKGYNVWGSSLFILSTQLSCVAAPCHCHKLPVACLQVMCFRPSMHWDFEPQHCTRGPAKSGSSTRFSRRLDMPGHRLLILFKLPTALAISGVANARMAQPGPSGSAGRKLT